MADLVKFVQGTATEFLGLAVKDSNTLYFITDEQRIYKGDTPFSGGIFTTTTSYPASGEVNTLYVNTVDGSVKYWNGQSYQEVVKPTATSFSDSGDDLHLPTTKAVVDYVTTQIQDMDLSAVTNRIDTLESKMNTVQGTGEGSISKALEDAKDYADSLAPNYAAASHTHTLSEITDAGDLAGKDQVAESDLETTLASKLNNKADKATTLTGYGITDAYTKGEVDSAINTAVANADHLKREIVEALPDAGSADENTIYMVPQDGTIEDPGTSASHYNEYMLINGAFELIGTSAVDLTDYATKSYVDDAKSEAISTAGTNADSKISAKVGEIGDKTVKQYVDEQDATTLQSAKTYADGLSVNYATAAQGAKADTALQQVDITTGATNGTIAVKGTDVAVKGLGSAAYVDSAFFATAAQGTKADDAYNALTWGSLS